MPVFQPVLELATGRVAGYEALARMPEGPFRPPDQWFNQAHRCGLGPALEAAALRAALRAHGRPDRTFLALNVSPGALLSPEVRAALPERLDGIVIELTEHELFSTDDGARPRAGAAARTRRADRARRRGQRLRGPAADHPHRARHPEARPVAGGRGARRPAPLRAARGADLVRLHDARGDLRRGGRDARGPRRAGRAWTSPTRRGGRWRAPTRRGRRRRRRRPPPRRPRCGSACASCASRATTSPRSAT